MADAVTSQTLVDTSGTKTVMKFTNMKECCENLVECQYYKW